MGKYELLIGTSRTEGFIPVVQEDVTLSLHRRGSPGKLSFNMLKDTAPIFEEGAPGTPENRWCAGVYGLCVHHGNNKKFFADSDGL